MTGKPVLYKLFSAVRSTSTHSPCFSCGAFATCSTKSDPAKIQRWLVPNKRKHQLPTALPSPTPKGRISS
ncbi:hypothetical protein M404DRAFT_764021 [Pisolithus tinctorius Marx 270]|uniref:Uncharacterized protein n=1 Tax=Pisolithus tinctorius Marx 270 TaxID=870435 RepID=A0A0C3IUA8_PISTI|nr:hypothetical protein M404DRAFT_764021 [Pisolithus tinctorius Marx 270]